MDNLKITYLRSPGYTRHVIRVAVGDEEYVDLRCYGIWLTDLRPTLKSQSKKLVRAWEAMNINVS